MTYINYWVIFENQSVKCHMAIIDNIYFHGTKPKAYGTGKLERKKHFHLTRTLGKMGK